MEPASTMSAMRLLDLPRFGSEMLSKGSLRLPMVCDACAAAVHTKSTLLRHWIIAGHPMHVQ